MSLRFRSTRRRRRDVPVARSCRLTLESLEVGAGRFQRHDDQRLRPRHGRGDDRARQRRRFRQRRRQRRFRRCHDQRQTAPGRLPSHRYAPTDDRCLRPYSTPRAGRSTVIAMASLAGISSRPSEADVHPADAESGTATPPVALVQPRADSTIESAFPAASPLEVISSWRVRLGAPLRLGVPLRLSALWRVRRAFSVSGRRSCET